MIYDQNTTNLKLITDWITASLGRVSAQVQEPYIDFINISNPFAIDPYGLDPDNYAIELPDGYIMPKFTGNQEYQTYTERTQMATEGATALTNKLAVFTYKTHQTDTEFSAGISAFFQTLYTRATDLIWVDKIHPQEIVGNILFNGDYTTYANRVPVTGAISPDDFLHPWDSYDLTVWTNKLSSYSGLASNVFFWGKAEPSFFLPGKNYQLMNNFNVGREESLTLSLRLSLTGYLLTVVGDNSALFESQYWVYRLNILCAAAVHFTPYLSYLGRNPSS